MVVDARGRTLALVVLAFVVVGCAAGAALVASARGAALTVLRHDTESRAALMAHSLSPAVEFADATVVGAAFQGAALDEDFVGAIARGGDGTEVARLGEIEVRPEDEGRRIVAEAPVDLSADYDGSLRLVVSTAGVDRAVEAELPVAIGIAVGSALVGVLVGALVSRRRVA